MRRLKYKLNMPIWYIFIVVLVLAALIIYSMILPYVQIMRGIPIDLEAYPNPNIWEKLHPIKDYALRWGIMDIAGVFVCLFLGLLCFLLGITRSINKLSGKQIYMQALFLVLFAVNNLSIAKITEPYIRLSILFYTYWITFFTYPIALFVYYFYYYTPDFQKWTWPLLAVPATYSVASFIMFFIFGLPFDMPGKYYTDITVFCFVLYLLLGLIKVNQKSMTWFIRAISAFWIAWLCYIIIKTQLGIQFICITNTKTA